MGSIKISSNCIRLKYCNPILRYTYNPLCDSEQWGDELLPGAMKKIQLEYCKFILEKVSFDALLFQKELRKALKILVDADARELINWVKSRFKGQEVLLKVDISYS